MKIKTNYLYACLTVILLFGGISPVQATPNDDSNKAKTTLKNMRSEIKELKHLLRHSAVLATVSKSKIAGKFTDSDSDGLPDILESVEHTNACDDDSDDDGISDGDEANQGSNGDDASEGEIEVTGLISAITTETVTVEGHTCTATDTTDFRDGSSLADYLTGNNVEIKCKLGLINGSTVLTLKRIKLEN